MPCLPLPTGAGMLATSPTCEHLFALFPGSTEQPRASNVTPAELPQPYRRLLAHTHHMTVTVEEFFRSRVDVRVLDFWLSESEYARKSLLSLQSTGRIVQFGLVRINLGVCPHAVRDAIVEGKTPLGRVLIEHNMLRRIEPVAFLRIELAEPMADWFGVAPGTETHGRVGLIYTGERPVVEVLEILAPVVVPGADR